jgi:hypothetical protein
VPKHRRDGLSVHTVVVLLVILVAVTGAASPHSATSPDPSPAGVSPEDLRAAGPWDVADHASLTPVQRAQAVVGRARLSPAQRDRLDGILAAASGPARAYLIQAFAAGHSVPQVAAFAAVLVGRSPHWMRTRLRPVDPDEPGPAKFHGASVSQYDDTTCGAAVVVVARAMVDPIYALQLTTGGRPDWTAESDSAFQDRLRAQEQRVHQDADRLWLKAAGTPPWGVSDQLNRGLAGLGVRYGWTLLVGGRPSKTAGVIRRALSAARQGYLVPILIGDVIPRHYVLLVHDGAAGAVFYEPTAGDVVVLPHRDLQRQDFRLLGFTHLKGAILPRL